MILDARKSPGITWPRGSVRANLETDLSAPDDPAVGGRHPLPRVQDWCATLGGWGITPETDVIVTDDQHGGLAAARCWWMLRAVGHTRVTVVPLQSLDAPLTNEPTLIEPAAPYPADSWLLPTVDAAEVERRRRDPAWRVIDARSAPRYRGENEPIDPVAGHIPGALNLPWEDNTDLGTFGKNLSALLGDTPIDQVIVHCGSGVTACHTLLQLHRLDRDLPALYVGSWSEWCRNPASSVEK